MTRTSIFAAIPAVSLALLAINLPQIAAAHTEGTCVNNGVEACNAQWPNNYDARLACTTAVLNACKSHSHGGSGVDPASKDFTADGGQEPSSAQRGFRLPRR